MPVIYREYKRTRRYNRDVRNHVVPAVWWGRRSCRLPVLLAVALLTISCSRDIQNTDAVKQGVTEYLKASQAKTGLNLDAMQIEVRSVSFERDQARANVYISPKGMQTGGMQLTYVLARTGNKWVVRGRTESGANPHGNQMQEGSPQQGLPPGHPQVPPGGDRPASALPPGHPPMGSKQ
jgi:hypothetical protein